MSESKNIVGGIGLFADEMRKKGIHVGLGANPRCVTCGEPWPCAASSAPTPGVEESPE